MKRKIVVSLFTAALGLALCSCTAPIRADRVTMRQASAQVEASALSTGKPGPSTTSILHRYRLERLALKQPDEAVRQLHAKASATGERDLLFALAELSYLAGDHVRRSVKPWDPREARDYYLGAAVYAWIFLFGGAQEAPPTAFDRRFRAACDLYNYGLGRALLERKSTNGVVELADSYRRLPVGGIEVQLNRLRLPVALEAFDEILLTDQFRVRGLSVRNREPGLGTPLICVQPLNREFQMRPCLPATVLLRCPGSLSELAAGSARCALEIYSGLDQATVAVGDVQVPLELDLTTFRAYALNQSRIWRLGKLDFLAPTETIRNQLILHQPYDPNRIPVVFVHGTFSSPVTWAEMANTLTADPILRRRYQVWTFIYGSGNPLIQSISDFRASLDTQVKQLDPEGTNTALRQMVIIGHSQGGLLTKATAVDTGDRLWRVFSTNRLENLDISEPERERLRGYLFLEPLSFVKRVVFIATPHRGSYLAGGLARRLAQRLVSLPGHLVSRSSDLQRLTAGSEAGRFLRSTMPTSLDGMSPKNPALLAMAEIAVVPEIESHSIIAVRGQGDCQRGRDGVVSYQSAHLDHVTSEYIVCGKHSCLNLPATIEEVRRILKVHLKELDDDLRACNQ